jgi:RNA recognition motif-containing protein
MSLQGWMDQQQQPQGLPSFALSNSNLNAMQNSSYGHDVDEELIPTAIVIKNIPFAVKKEQLVQLMTDLRLPLPYAFNYHFDNGVFRGLAFANFTTAEETAAVIESMNHFELNGRKLRVEYKKMLPLAERERIEREKRERRGQLEEQHRPLGGGLQSQASFGSLASHIPATSPSPVSAMRGGGEPKSISMFNHSQHSNIVANNLRRRSQRSPGFAVLFSAADIQGGT